MPVTDQENFVEIAKDLAFKHNLNGRWIGGYSGNKKGDFIFVRDDGPSFDL
jgi:hypothetical protein